LNLFLTDRSFSISVQELDYKRLIKQILECKTLLDICLGKKQGYKDHPVAVHYKNNPFNLAYYGLLACCEYEFRFTNGLTRHRYHEWFSDIASEYFKTELFVPFYCEGKKDDPKHIRTTENVYELFKEKLIKKWQSDKIPPKWTKRGMPLWYVWWLEKHQTNRPINEVVR